MKGPSAENPELSMAFSFKPGLNRHIAVHVLPATRKFIHRLTVPLYSTRFLPLLSLLFARSSGKHIFPSGPAEQN